MTTHYRLPDDSFKDGLCLVCSECPLPADHSAAHACTCRKERTLWFSKDLSVRDEALIPSLLRYRQADNRVEAEWAHGGAISPNLISSLTGEGKHRPIIDLDGPHSYRSSSSEGHAHLYLDTPISWWRWAILMWALRLARVLNTGGFWWTIRRGQNFVRIPGETKTESNPTMYSYGYLFKRRRK